MTKTKQFFRDLEAAAEQAVRNDLNFRRVIGTGGETERRANRRWTLWFAVLAFLAVAAAVLAPYLVHPS